MRSGRWLVARENNAHPHAKVLYWLFIATALLYLFTAGSNFTSGDSYAELRVTHSLLSHGWVDVPRAAGCGPSSGAGAPGHDGLCYATHGIGYSLWLLPFLLLSNAVTAIFSVPLCANWWLPGTSCVPILLLSWNTCLLSAGIVALLCRLCLDLGYSVRRSLAVSLFYGFASLAWPYARFGFDVTPTAFLLLGAVREALLASRASESRVDPDVSATRRWLRAGGLSALAILCRLTSIAAVIPIGLFLLWTRRGGRPGETLRALGAFVLPLMIVAAFSGWYDLVRFGGILDDGHSHNAADALVLNPLVGLLGMAISPGKGLLWYCPVVVLAFGALPAFYRRQPSACVLALALAGASLLPYVLVNDWYGGSAWGPRFLLPVLPLLLLPALELPEVLAGNVRRRMLAGLVVTAGVLVALVGQLVSYPERLRALVARWGEQGVLWDPRYSPLADHVAILASYISHPSAATQPLPPAPGSFSIWWLDLWRIHQVPERPTLAVAAVFLALTILAAWRLSRAVSASPPLAGETEPTTNR